MLIEICWKDKQAKVCIRQNHWGGVERCVMAKVTKWSSSQEHYIIILREERTNNDFAKAYSPLL
jgi:hypothetical protein